jgi:hypothetical protein
LLPKFARNARNTEQKSCLVESLKFAYAQLASNKSKENLPVKNALLTIAVSNQIGPSQRFISKAIGGTKYLLGKVVSRRIHGDLMGENIWGGLPQKRRSNVLDETHCQKVLDFWDTPTTISPIAKDVKRRRRGMKTLEDHPIHYLQETHVYYYIIIFCFCFCVILFIVNVVYPLFIFMLSYL